MSQVPDPAFVEAVNQNMQVPVHLSVSPGQQWWEKETEEAMRRPEEPPPIYTMQVPDRLTYTETPDMSPRPLFARSKPTICSPLGLAPCWESPFGDVLYGEELQNPMRRSYSDQSFGRTPPGTPTQLKQALVLPRHLSSFYRVPEEIARVLLYNFRISSRALTIISSVHPLHQQSTASLSAQTTDPQAKIQPLLFTPLSILSPQSILQVAKQLGLQASQHLLQTVSQKYRTMENCSPEEEAGTAVEFLILRRQVMKMSRRLAALERHNAERRNTEVVLFSLLLSACLLNVWLWLRR